MSVIYDPNKILPKRSTRRPRKPTPRLRLPSLPATPGVSPQAWLVMLVLVVVGTGYALRGQINFSARPDQATSAVTAAQEQIAPDRTYLSLDDAAANRILKLSFIAPKAWRTTRLKADNAALLNPKDYQVGLFSFATTGSLEPSGQLSIENVNAWVNANGARRASMDFLISLRRQRNVTPKDAEKIIGLDESAKSSLRYVNSADGKLSGVVYVTNVGIGAAAKPHVFSQLAGTIDGQTIYARLDLDDGGQVDTATALVKSLILDTSAKNAQAPAITK